MDQQRILFKIVSENIADVKYSFHVAKFISEGWRLFIYSDIVNIYMLKVSEEVYPDEVNTMASVSLSASTVTRWDEDLGINMFSQHGVKTSRYTASSLALD